MKPIHLFAILLIIVVAIAVGVGYSWGSKDFYDDSFKCDLILEQRVACLRGCLFYHEPLEGNECVGFCEDRYRVAFNEEGNIDECGYSPSYDGNAGDAQ